MSTQILLPLIVVFASVAVAAGAMLHLVLTGTAPERRRLRQMATDGGGPASGLILDTPTLMDGLSPAAKRVSSLIPTSPAELGQLRRRLTMAGYRDVSAAIWFSTAKVVLPIA